MMKLLSLPPLGAWLLLLLLTEPTATRALCQAERNATVQCADYFAISDIQACTVDCVNSLVGTALNSSSSSGSTPVAGEKFDNCTKTAWSPSLCGAFQAQCADFCGPCRDAIYEQTSCELAELGLLEKGCVLDCNDYWEPCFTEASALLQCFNETLGGTSGEAIAPCENCLWDMSLFGILLDEVEQPDLNCAEWNLFVCHEYAPCAPKCGFCDNEFIQYMRCELVATLDLVLSDDCVFMDCAMLNSTTTAPPTPQTNNATTTAVCQAEVNATLQCASAFSPQDTQACVNCIENLASDLIIDDSIPVGKVDNCTKTSWSPSVCVDYQSRCAELCGPCTEEIIEQTSCEFAELGLLKNGCVLDCDEYWNTTAPPTVLAESCVAVSDAAIRCINEVFPNQEDYFRCQGDCILDLTLNSIIEGEAQPEEELTCFEWNLFTCQEVGSCLTQPCGSCYNELIQQVRCELESDNFLSDGCVFVDCDLLNTTVPPPTHANSTFCQAERDATVQCASVFSPEDSLACADCIENLANDFTIDSTIPASQVDNCTKTIWSPSICVAYEARCSRHCGPCTKEIVEQTSCEFAEQGLLATGCVLDCNDYWNTTVTVTAPPTTVAESCFAVDTATEACLIETLPPEDFFPCVHCISNSTFTAIVNGEEQLEEELNCAEWNMYVCQEFGRCSTECGSCHHQLVQQAKCELEKDDLVSDGCVFQDCNILNLTTTTRPPTPEKDCMYSVINATDTCFGETLVPIGVDVWTRCINCHANVSLELALEGVEDLDKTCGEWSRFACDIWLGSGCNEKCRDSCGTELLQEAQCTLDTAGVLPDDCVLVDCDVLMTTGPKTTPPSTLNVPAPTVVPSPAPTLQPSVQPFGMSMAPMTAIPTPVSSTAPSFQPSAQPQVATLAPVPLALPSATPSVHPSSRPPAKSPQPTSPPQTTPPSVAATPICNMEGGACSSSNPCCGMSLKCAKNGMCAKCASDGKLCMIDRDCCSDSCKMDKCAGWSRRPTMTTLPSRTFRPSVTASPTRLFLGGAACGVMTDACVSDSECCGPALKCLNGICTDCVMQRGGCQNTMECCNGGKKAVCDNMAGVCIKCRRAGKRCRQKSDCCSNMCKMRTCK